MYKYPGTYTTVCGMYKYPGTYTTVFEFKPAIISFGNAFSIVFIHSIWFEWSRVYLFDILLTTTTIFSIDEHNNILYGFE